ncbi:aspartate/glutamate racemase family protein [Butyrivibrio sp. LB2008]|uniref:aspartate/glutamate racemase family protein n=1 Tax=Butyrivibrio sp. LB2008 TaxID=1408305 RepID=UPI00047D25B0|nr:aspartate/glutamate racemase family protein [Butyrivibrio sp. LB2008]
MNIVKGGKTFYGYEVGIIMLDTKFPRIQGDIGNALSFGYPVLFEKVVDWKPSKVVLDLSKKDIEPFIDAAKRLERAGCKIISTSCGFLSLFQKEIADSVDVSVFTSALIMAPMIKQTISSDKKVCILTANKKTLSNEHLFSVGINRNDYIIYGLEEEKTFTNFTVQNWDEVDVDECRNDLLKVTRRAISDNNIGAILLECTNMPPFANDIKRISGLPVYDIISLLGFAKNAL